jgi:hypothetical protein
MLPVRVFRTCYVKFGSIRSPRDIKIESMRQARIDAECSALGGLIAAVSEVASRK